MALSLKEAVAVNTLLEWLVDPVEPGLDTNVIAAAALLAESAYARLAAGVTGPEVERRTQVCHR